MLDAVLNAFLGLGTDAFRSSPVLSILVDCVSYHVCLRFDIKVTMANSAYDNTSDVFYDLQSDDEDIPFDDDVDFVNEDGSNSTDSEESEVNQNKTQVVGSDDDWTIIDKIPNIDIFCCDNGMTDVPELDSMIM
ncbi:uncharacterized protein LOC142323028 [Lycorma delicatula]|uniref:uncharacterized protein LOC142323028 n=1 Tax=Lycorma delicatula TaxID=130591 RepID=UPI003F50D5CB